MSGICGIIAPNKDEKFLIDTVFQMCNLLKHRGADGRRVINGTNWAIGCCQRKIFDLSENATQPMVSEDHSCFLISDGRISNHHQLRVELEKRGHVFKSASDNEVILHLLEEEGEEGIARLKGQFAFAFVDTHSRSLFLVRDRFGVKPLYYMKLADAFIFASEIKALFCYPKNFPGLNMERISEFLQYRYIAGEETLFSGVYVLEAGSYLRVNFENITVAKTDYWTLGPRDGSIRWQEEELIELLRQSVRKFISLDVPVGVQLSGGLDSSTITKLASEACGEVKHAFCASFPGEVVDEIGWAKQVARECSVVLHEVQYEQQDFIEDLAYCTWFHDEPLNHPNSCALYRVSRAAGSYVAVVLSGEGGDEMFGGYSWQRRIWRLSRAGGLIYHPSLRLLKCLLPRKSRFGRLRAVLGKSIPEIIVEVPKCVDNKILEELLCTNLYHRNAETYIDFHENFDILTAMLSLDLRTTLLSALQRQDRMSMAGGVEPFMPYLDDELAEKLLRIPSNMLLEGGHNKAILKRIASKLLPVEIVQRPKIGFRVPLARWMQDRNQNLYRLLDWLYDESAISRKIWRADVANRFVRLYLSGSQQYFEILWSMLAFEIWARLWLDGASAETLTEKIIKQCHLDKQRKK